MSRSTNWAAVAALVLLVSADPARVARGQAIGPGFELERSGRYADAASLYFTTIRSDPTNIPALLGLERTLFVLSRVSELLPLVQNARARQPGSAGGRGAARRRAAPPGGRGARGGGAAAGGGVRAGGGGGAAHEI